VAGTPEDETISAANDRPTTADSGAGRRGAAKRRAVLDAAGALFLEGGYGATSMDAVAERAGVAKQTLYNHFGSKEALFAAICGELCDRLLGELPSVVVPAGAAEAPLEEVLLGLARRHSEVILTPASLALHRILVAESPRFPELGPATWAAGGIPALDTLAHFLAERERRGELALDDPHLAAERFYGAITGCLQVRALLNVEPRPAPGGLERRLRGCVAAFVAGHRPRERARAAE